MQTTIKHYNELGIDYYRGTSKAIKVSGWQKEETNVSEKSNFGEFIGPIIKENGLKLDKSFLVVVDIDAKKDYGNTEEEQKELLEKSVALLGINKYYPWIERTTSGGYHIFLKVNKSDFKKLKNFSVPVEYMEDGSKCKKEIEIFMRGRFIATFPSPKYKLLSSAEFINFKELGEISFESLDMLNALSCSVEKENGTDEDYESNTGSTDSYLKKSFSNIPELKAFSEGEWHSYNFVKDEIMRFFIVLNKEDEFLRIIEKYWPVHFKTWENFPIHYLTATDGNRLPSKNSKHLEWLKKIGYLKTKNKKEALKDDMFVIFEAIAGKETLSLGDSTFIYNGKSYEWLNPIEYDLNIYKHYYKHFGKMLNKEEVSELVHHFRMYLRMNSKEYNPADKLKCINRVPLTFQNGTLYVYKNEKVWKENYWSHEDRCFIEFSIDFNPEFEYSYFTDWVEARFVTDDKKRFFQMVIGDLFTTDSTTDIHAYFWGGAGIGKSTISNLLQKVTTRGTVDFMKLDKIKDKFSRVKTLRTPILIADEASERNIPESEYKSTISREADDYEMKNVQNFNGQPIAKFLTFANILPNIKMDAGVKRRLCVLEVADTKIYEELSESEFAEKLGSCQNELINFIIDGVHQCFDIKWRLSNFYQENFGEEKRNVIEANDNFSYFLEQCFIRSNDLDDKEQVVFSMDAYRVYNEFLTTLEGTAMQKMTVTKFGTKIKELGVDTKRIKVGGIKKTVYIGIIHSMRSLDLLNRVEVE